MDSRVAREIASERVGEASGKHRLQKMDTASAPARQRERGDKINVSVEEIQRGQRTCEWRYREHASKRLLN